MEPRIQYATTDDGVSIAYWTLGDGHPLVFMGDAPWSHIQMEWQIPELRQWYEKLAEGRTLVRFDQRGGGLSDRNPQEISLDGFQRDLEAVVDRLGLETFDLLGFVDSGPVVIAYTARNPDRVSHLILWCTYATAGEYTDVPVIRGTHSLLAQDWQLYTETLAHVAMGWSLSDSARRAADLMREAFTAEAMERTYEAVAQYETRGLLGQIRTPSLVVHRRGVRWLPEETSRRLASRIPDASLLILDGDSVAPFLSDWQAALDAITGFLGDSAQKRAHAGVSGTAIILFADIADSTSLTERLGDAAFRAKARDLDGALRAAIREHGGKAIEGKVLGDGVMAVFASAREAIEAAVTCSRAGDEAGLPLHLGLHAGDVISEEGNVYGGAVNVAARIAGLSVAGEVLVSETVRSLAHVGGRSVRGPGGAGAEGCG
jgi:class 3 adenylate cyclase